MQEKKNEGIESENNKPQNQIVRNHKNKKRMLKKNQQDEISIEMEMKEKKIPDRKVKEHFSDARR